MSKPDDRAPGYEDDPTADLSHLMPVTEANAIRDMLADQLEDAESILTADNENFHGGLLEHAKDSFSRRAFREVLIWTALNPLTNEGLRFGVFAAALGTTRNPLVGSLVLGGTTLLVEGTGGLAAADALEKNDRSSVGWIDKKLRYLPEDLRLTNAAKAGVAMTFGTAALTTLKERENTSITPEQRRRGAISPASYLAGFFAVEGALISEGLGNYHNISRIGWVVGGLGALSVGSKFVRGRIETKSETLSGVELTDDQISEGMSAYESYHDLYDEQVRIGLYGDDLKTAFTDPRTVFIRNKTGESELFMPILVPADLMGWYNLKLLRETYGKDTQVYYYAHPPIIGRGDMTAVRKSIKDVIDSGGVIFTDLYQTRLEVKTPSSREEKVWQRLSKKYQLDQLGGGDAKRTAETFIGHVDINGESTVKNTLSFFEAYREGVESGEFQENPQNGVSVIDVVGDEDTKRLWQIYRKPFDDLGVEHPAETGFDEKGFIEILKDPSVVKVVNRVDGKISTLCIFVQDFDHCPWFNEDLYQSQYPEYFNSNNVLIFPGIVSDENMRGNNYAMDVINLAADVVARRGSNVLITFECTETSAQYVPKIVTSAINSSGILSVHDLEQPVSVTEYMALKKAS